MKRPSMIRCLLTVLIFCCSALLAGDNKSASLLDEPNLVAWREPRGQWTMADTVQMPTDHPDRLLYSPGDAILVNGPSGRTNNLLSRDEFGDAEVHVEFMIPSHSNSGVYLMSRYEVQILDSFGVAKEDYPGGGCGGIYPRWIDNRNVEGHSPKVNASRKPGEWQTYDITFCAPRFDASGKKTANARFVKVVQNGQLIHENVEVTGPTRAANFEDEKLLGPLMLQGDHGPVAFRNLRVRALREPPATEPAK